MINRITDPPMHCLKMDYTLLIGNEECDFDVLALEKGAHLYVQQY